MEPRSAAKRQGKRPAERGRRPQICGESAHTAPAPAGHSKVFGQAFFKKVAGHGVEPRSAAKRQGKRPAERGRRPRIRGGSAHSAPAPARYNKVFGQTFFKKLAGHGVEPRSAAEKTAQTPFQGLRGFILSGVCLCLQESRICSQFFSMSETSLNCVRQRSRFWPGRWMRK